MRTSNRMKLQLSVIWVMLMLGSVNATAQSTTQSTFNKEYYQALQGTTRTIAVDLNNDGVKDLVTVDESQNLLAAQLANGNGGFNSRIDWAVNHGFNAYVSLAAGDLDQDGNADVVLTDGSSTLTVFFGDGHGDYCRTCSNITLPFYALHVQITDVNHDGHPDIVVAGGDARIGASVVAVLYGNGSRQFTAPSIVYTFPTAEPLGSEFVAGDFDGDGNADFAYTGQLACDRANNCKTPFGVLYGDGKGGFTKATPQTFNFIMTIGSYDVNQDGRSDVIFTAVCGANPSCTSGIGVAYGQPGRTLDVHESFTPGFQPTSDAPAAGDFNGDGIIDLVAVGYDLSNDYGVLIAQGDTSYGSWKNQFVEYLGTDTFPNQPIVSDWNRDQKPDIVTVESFTIPPTSPAQIVALLNSTAGGIFSTCPYPSVANGINVCSPVNGSTQGSSVTFSASANSFYPVRKLEVWVDGVKMKEVFNSWMNFSASFKPGSHQAVFYSAGYDNSLQKKVVNFTVSSATCSDPATPGINVCSPSNGSQVSSPVSVLARGTVTGSILRMEVWVDGVKKYSTFGSDTLQTSLPLPPGNHNLDFYIVNTQGQKWKSTIKVTVK